MLILLLICSVQYLKASPNLWLDLWLNVDHVQAMERQSMGEGQSMGEEGEEAKEAEGKSGDEEAEGKSGDEESRDRKAMDQEGIWNGVLFQEPTQDANSPFYHEGALL